MLLKRGQNPENEHNFTIGKSSLLSLPIFSNIFLYKGFISLKQLSLGATLSFCSLFKLKKIAQIQIDPDRSCSDWIFKIELCIHFPQFRPNQLEFDGTFISYHRNGRFPMDPVKYNKSDVWLVFETELSIYNFVIYTFYWKPR